MVSGTHQFMGRMANGYDLRRPIAAKLVGGTAAIVAIARLAGRPPILVFDEPTSAMDAQTEDGLIERLKRSREPHLVVIRHRPTLLKPGQADHGDRAGAWPPMAARRDLKAHRQSARA